MAFVSLVKKRIGALLVTNDALFATRRVQVIALAIRHAMPALFYAREWVEAGGLMSYGTSLADNYRQLGVYCGRILKGEKPADLPVIQAAKFELVINSQIARTLGVVVPTTLLARADELIE
jgi:putative ABC transport system substrate-binding protein